LVYESDRGGTSRKTQNHTNPESGQTLVQPTPKARYDTPNTSVAWAYTLREQACVTMQFPVWCKITFASPSEN